MFSFSLCFTNLAIMYLEGVFFVFILHGDCCISWIHGLVFSSDLESFSYYFFKYVFLPAYLSPPHTQIHVH